MLVYKIAMPVTYLSSDDKHSPPSPTALCVAECVSDSSGSKGEVPFCT